MNSQYTPQNSSSPPCLYLSIPLEVAQDECLSDGAILLFGEIYGLQRSGRLCFASDDHFMSRRGKGRSTIQRQIAELRKRGYVQGAFDQSRRVLQVADRFLTSKNGASFPKNETTDEPCLKNETEESEAGLENDNTSSASRLRNETHKTPEFRTNNSEKRTTQSPPSRVVSQKQPLSDADQEKQVQTVMRALGDAKNEAQYRSLFLQASERGRLDAWNVAFDSTQKASQKSGHMKQAPIAYFRKVLMTTWELDQTYVETKATRQEEAKKDSSAVPPPAQKPPIVAEERNEKPSAQDKEGSLKKDRNKFNPSDPVGDAKSFRPFSAPPTDTSPRKNSGEAYEQLVASLPDDTRDGIVAQAKQIVREKNSGKGFPKSSTYLYFRLLMSEIKAIYAKETV